MKTLDRFSFTCATVSRTGRMRNAAVTIAAPGLMGIEMASRSARRGRTRVRMISRTRPFSSSISTGFIR
jgi:hypothetical protein